MGTAKPYRVFVLLLCFLFSTLLVSSSAYAEELSLVFGQSSKLQLLPSLKILNSPGIKQGASVLCARIYVHGLPRLKNLDKYAHSLKVKVLTPRSSSSLHGPTVEVCFHRNATIGIGMCSESDWEKVDKGSWVRAMSPFDHKLLDIRMAGLSSENLVVSIEEGDYSRFSYPDEEFFLYRVVFLFMGIFLLNVASVCSKSFAFYYGSAMAVGVLFVTLVVIFQGMKLLPIGRKSSLAFCMYSSMVGLGSFLLRYLPGFLHSVLIEMGISEDLYYPLAYFSLAFIVLSGAWMGFWAVRKLVLTEEGLIDITTANLVALSIRILSIGMVLFLSSLDHLLPVGAIGTGLIVPLILRRIFRLIFRSRAWSILPGLNRAPPGHLQDQNFYPSSYCRPCGWRKFPKKEWEKSTRDFTEEAIQELVSSPEFGIWAAANAYRISLALSSSSTPVQQRKRWILRSL